MNDDRLLGNMEAYKKLAEKLNSVEQVSRYDSGEEKQAWTLA